jgi:hypothetical protein
MKTLMLMIAVTVVLAAGCKPEERNQEPVVNVNAPVPTNNLVTNVPPAK